MVELMCVITEEWRLEVRLKVISENVGLLSPFKISLFLKNRGIWSAPRMVRKKVHQIRSIPGECALPQKLGARRKIDF